VAAVALGVMADAGAMDAPVGVLVAGARLLFLSVLIFIR
jgi:hypothetical protein